MFNELNVNISNRWTKMSSNSFFKKRELEYINIKTHTHTNQVC